VLNFHGIVRFKIPLERDGVGTVLHLLAATLRAIETESFRALKHLVLVVLIAHVEFYIAFAGFLDILSAELIGFLYPLSVGKSAVKMLMYDDFYEFGLLIQYALIVKKWLLSDVSRQRWSTERVVFVMIVFMIRSSMLRQYLINYIL
jgi:hypothetical protein